MACAQVIGNDAAIAVGGMMGNFQLNTMLPLIGRNLLQQVQLLSRAAEMFTLRLLRGLQADRGRMESLNERSLSLATALVPVIGYDMAAEVAKEAHRTGKTVREIVRERKVLEEKELDRLLDPESQVGPDRSRTED
jgi:fumarate hydratase class II